MRVPFRQGATAVDELSPTKSSGLGAAHLTAWSRLVLSIVSRSRVPSVRTERQPSRCARVVDSDMALVRGTHQEPYEGYVEKPGKVYQEDLRPEGPPTAEPDDGPAADAVARDRPLAVIYQGDARPLAFPVLSFAEPLRLRPVLKALASTVTGLPSVACPLVQ